MINPAHRFAPFLARPSGGYKDADDRDDDGLSESAAKETADFIKDAYRQATGENPVGDDDDADGIEASVGTGLAPAVRTFLAAAKRAGR